jgi:hypothetical protein
MPSPIDPRSKFVPLPGQVGTLGYAPPARSSNRVLAVIIAGLLTTAAALAGHYLLSVHADFRLMGWYLDYVLPIGAVLVGLVASSGYAISSLWLGVRIRRGLLLTIVLLMLGAYFAAEYIEFHAQGPLIVQDNPNAVSANPPTPGVPPGYHPLGFWEYFHLKAINWAWKKDNDRDKDSEPLGMGGYFFVLLGIAGFTLSGLILPGLVGARPYCELCQRYMKRRQLTLLPGSMPYRKFSKKEADTKTQYDQQHQATWEQATAKAQGLIDAAKRNDPDTFTQLLAEPVPPRKQVDKLPRRLSVSLCRCPSCASGFLETTMTIGQGKKIKATKLVKETIPAEFIRALP